MNYGGGQIEFDRYGGSAAKRVDDAVCGSHKPQFAQIASLGQAPLAVKVLESASVSDENAPMLSEREILEALEAKGVPKNEIARTLGIDESGVTRLYNSGRRLKLDEARALVERFELPGAKISPLNLQVAKLLILYAADALNVPLRGDDPRVSELAQDFRAFSRFATDPRVRESEDAAAGFFQGLRQSRDPIA